MSKEETAHAEIAATEVDDELSLQPYFQVNRMPETASVVESVNLAMQSDQEAVLAKLFFATNMVGQSGMMVFTNKRVVTLSRRPFFLTAIFKMLEQMISKIPLIGWILDIIKDLFESFFHLLSKAAKNDASFLLNIRDEVALVEFKKGKPRKIERHVMAVSQSYADVVRPSLGLSIRYRLLNFLWFRFRTTTVRFIPLGNWRQKLSAWLDPAEYLFSDRQIISALSRFCSEIQPVLKQYGVLVSPEANEFQMRWQEDFGIPKGKWRIHAGTVFSVIISSVGVLLLLNGLEVFGHIRSSEEIISLWLGSFTLLGGIIGFAAGRSFGLTFLWSFFWIAPVWVAFIEAGAFD